MKCYACKNKDNTIRLNSSSGGVFTALAEQIIDEGGTVIGAAFNGLDVAHIAITEKKDIHRLRGSKYVQSAIDYSLIPDNRKVLFSGTPCQMPNKDILKVEVVCHGTPQREIFKQYCEELGVEEINFRNKDNGWNNYEVVIKTKNGIIRQKFWDNIYMMAFIKNLILNDKCFKCPFKEKSNADITLGDFWGIQNEYPEFADNVGVSIVIIRTPRGEEYFNKIKDKLGYIEVDLDKAIKWNPCITKSSIPHPKLDEFKNTNGNIIERMNKFI